MSAAISIKRAGKVKRALARAIVTEPVSSGSRNISSVLRELSATSSRNSTPLWASDTSPGRGIEPPPIIAVAEALWCGDRIGGRPAKSESIGLPVIECSAAASRAWCGVSGGKIPGNACARRLLPLPGGPCISKLCAPLAVSSSAKRAFSCPRICDSSW